MSTKSQRLRIIFLWLALEIGFLVVLVQLFNIQCLNSREYPDQVLRTWVKRGNIYGRHHYQLASNRDMLSLYADPKMFSPQQKVYTARTLAPILDVSEDELFSKLSEDRRFVWLKRKIDYALLDPLKQLIHEEKIRGVYFRREQKRFYPNGSLVPHVVGFVDFDNKGIDGVELSYEEWMMAYSRSEFVRHDGHARPTDPRYIQEEKPDLSNSVVLTIDEMIQYTADAALTEACEKWQADSGSAIVMNPRTGEVLAMANYPSLDLNEYGKVQEFRKRNRAIWFAYEPGSGFKTFAMAAALSEGTVTPDTSINCENGTYDYHGRILHDTHPSGVISATQVLARSSNIGMAKISEKVGIRRLADHLRAFGFGEATGIDLPYERSGNTSALSRWGDEAAGYIGFGHGITVTPLQMLVAMNVIANDGLLMKPYVVQEVHDGDERIVQQMKPTELRRVLSPQIARQVRQMLTEAVERVESHEAKVAGTRVAGKTGTAQKASQGGYSDEAFVSSFTGFLPADDPQVSIIVVIDQPQNEHLGRKVAAPVFRKIAERTLELLMANSQLAYHGASRNMDDQFE